MKRSLPRAIVVLLLLITTSALADPGPKERLDATPNGWYWLHGVTAAQITDVINTYDMRLIDIEVQTSDPLTFSAAFVQNAGAHAVNGWWWYFGIPFEDIAVFVDQNQGRLIDIERYGDGLYAVVMVANTGRDQKSWWYYGGTTVSQLGNLAAANGARLVDIESYDFGGSTYYDGIMISNTGDDASGWYWWLGADEAFINAQIQETGYRILDLDPIAFSDGVLFNVILVPPQSNWWWYYNLTPSQITSIVDQTGSRIVDIEPYGTRSGTRFAVALTNNSNALTTSLAGQLGYGADGSTGVYLREIGGSTLASLQPDFQFEPASTVKIFHHFHAWRQIKAGIDQTNSLMVYSENYNGSCPIGGAPMASRSLYETTRLMMWNSDNAATEAIRARYGEPAIMNSVNVFGGVSSNSNLNHAPLGCGTPAVNNPNELTLRDAGNLYEQIVATPVLDGVKTDFYETMQSHLTPEGNQWWLTDQVQQMVIDEATALGLPSLNAESFWNNMEIAWKPGGYGLNGLNYVSVAGTILIPECGAVGGYVDHDYVFGLFIHGSNDTQRLFDVTQEMFRGLINDGLESCRTVVDAPITNVARALTLENAVPNPFNPTTQIRFALADPGKARVDVIDTRGRIVTTLVNGFRDAGAHTVMWNGRDDAGASVSSGVYFVKAMAADEVQTRKITLLK